MAVKTWARPKPGAPNSIQVSPVSSRDPTTWTIMCCLPRVCVGRKLNGKQRGQNSHQHSSSTMLLDVAAGGLMLRTVSGNLCHSQTPEGAVGNKGNPGAGESQAKPASCPLCWTSCVCISCSSESLMTDRPFRCLIQFKVSRKYLKIDLPRFVKIFHAL